MAEIEDNVDRELFRNVEKLRALRIEHRDLDEVISRLNRNERDNRLAEALRDYTIASQACRRAASP